MREYKSRAKIQSDKAWMNGFILAMVVCTSIVLFDWLIW